MITTEGRVALEQALQRVPAAELARRIGFRRQAVSKWLHGFRKPEYRARVAMAKVLGIAMGAWDEIKETSSPPGDTVQIKVTNHGDETELRRRAG